MSAQQDQQMEGVQDIKGKGKAPQQDTMEESMDDDSSDESGAEDQAGEPEPEDEDNMEEIDSTNIIGSRTRGKTIDFAKANKDLGEDEDEEDDEEYIDPEDEMKE